VPGRGCQQDNDLRIRVRSARRRRLRIVRTTGAWRRF
jgi:hypothetical protein